MLRGVADLWGPKWGKLGRVKRVCFYHSGCPDGFGAAWAVWSSWGGEGRYLSHTHQERVRARDHAGDLVVFVDIAPRNNELRQLAEAASHVIVLDHHLSSRDRYEAEPDLANTIEELGHTVLFDLDHSGAVLAWRYFMPDQPLPDLLACVEDEDLWTWKLPYSRQVNAALASYARRFDIWSELAARPIAELVKMGEPIVRAADMEVERILAQTHTVALGTRRIEAVNATYSRSTVGHQLSRRQSFGLPWGCVYRIQGGTVHATLYSIGEVDVSLVAREYGGGGHRNAAGFSVPLREWLERFV